MTARLDPAREEQIRALLQQGLAIREVARRVGVSFSCVHRRATQMGLSFSRSHPNKEDHVWRRSPVGWRADQREKQRDA